MSIIYDALNKAQKRRNEENKSSKQLAIRKPIWRIALFILSTFTFILFIYTYSGYKIHAARHHQPLPAIAVSPAVKLAQHYALNGIFLSDSNQVAIINHAYYHIGDTLDNMKIVGMNANQVKLNKNGQILTLSMLH